jgi:hypothetical protein
VATAELLQLAGSPGQFGTQRRPLAAYPAADRCGKPNHSYSDNAEKYGVFNEGSALLILADLIEQFKSLRHRSTPQTDKFHSRIDPLRANPLLRVGFTLYPPATDQG